MQTTDARLVRFTTLLAAIAAFSVVTLLPAAYFASGYRYHSGQIAAETEFLSERVSRIVGHNPEMWAYEVSRIDEVIVPSSQNDHLERRLVRDFRREPVAEYVSSDRWSDFPQISDEVWIYDSGSVAGTLSIHRSLRPLLESTGLVALISLILGCGVFLALRTLPLKALQRAIERISFLASHDALTGLPNRELFADRLQQAMLLARRDKTQSVAVLALDLDKFKDVNDTLGHHYGDKLLIETADRLRDCLRESDTLARLSGDEFAIVQTGVNQPDGAVSLSKRIIETIGQPFHFDGSDSTIGASVGIALFPQNSDTMMALMVNADTALYRAKEEGRGKYCFFEEAMNEQLRLRREMERDLRTALAEGQFHLHYQPQIQLDNGHIIGVEALLRWHHPEHGNLPPDQFIPIAEDSGLIIPLGEWVLRKACKDALAWPDVKVAVNLSPVQFREPLLAVKVAQILADTGLPPTRLELEITEGILLQDTEATLETLKDIKKLGVRIAMDDFGTGYSSLSYLRRFPFDKIKVDRSFVSELGFGEDADAIVRAAINLAHSLGMRANAEGVETPEQAEKLLALGCEEAQGYMYSRPVPREEISQLIREDKTEFLEDNKGLYADKIAC